MLVIVGHGPSIVGKGLGKWLDEQTVVRMKMTKIPNSEDWGSRTDYLCGTSLSSNVLECDFWWLTSEDGSNVKADAIRQNVKKLDLSWFDLFWKFDSKRKPSTGMRAIWACMQFLKPEEIGLVAFDRLKDPDGNSGKWWEPVRRYYCHDAHAERRMADSLDVKLTWVT